MLQPRDRLENRRGTNNKMFRRVWKEMENGKIDKARMAKAKRERRTEEKEKRKDFRKLTIEEEIEIARVIKEKEEEENLIEIRMVDKRVPRQFYKYFKMFEKKESERMLTRKTWNHIIDLRKEFVLKKEKIYLLSRIEREEVQELVKNQLKKEYIGLSKSLQTLLVFFIPKKDDKKRMVQDYQYLNS